MPWQVACWKCNSSIEGISTADRAEELARMHVVFANCGGDVKCYEYPENPYPFKIVTERRGKYLIGKKVRVEGKYGQPPRS